MLACVAAGQARGRGAGAACLGVAENLARRPHQIVVDPVRQLLDLLDDGRDRAKVEEAVVRLAPKALALHVGLPCPPRPAAGDGEGGAGSSPATTAGACVVAGGGWGHFLLENEMMFPNWIIFPPKRPRAPRLKRLATLAESRGFGACAARFAMSRTGAGGCIGSRSVRARAESISSFPRRACELGVGASV